MPAPHDTYLSGGQHESAAGRRAFRRLAWIAVACTYALIVLGGVVRITGSGMGCGDDWPLCNGHLIPPMDLPTLVEYGHRLAAALVSLLVFGLAGLAGLAWLRHRREPARSAGRGERATGSEGRDDVSWTGSPRSRGFTGAEPTPARAPLMEPALVRPAMLAAVLLVVQVLLGAVTVKLELPAWSVVLHLGVAMLLLAALALAALRAGTLAAESTTPAIPAAPTTPAAPVPPRPLLPLARVAAAVGFGVVLLGALVANLHAGPACQGFPLCNGRLLPTPAGSIPVVVHWAHRMAAFAFVGLLLVVAARASRLTGKLAGGRAAAAAAWAVLALTAAQLGVAAAMVLRFLPGDLRAAHVALGAAIWLGLIVLVDFARRVTGTLPAGAHPGTHSAAAGGGRVAADLVALTKPRVISLLLVTTVLPMFVAGPGLPSAWLVLWTVIGGYAMAGGANAINMWFDRDIDDRMSRTRRRPIPAGRIRPGLALAFGLGLAAVAFAVFWFLVNPLAAWLALAGLLYYVFIYTVWLKRSTPVNIVIGGAAGAFPPLVGWAAATGRIDLEALYLFAIVFYWTPPHFWALALVKRDDYARAGVPMLPVVQGEHETKRQMLCYALMLVPLTVVPSLFGAAGALYAVAALALGGRLIWYCIRLLRERGVTPTAWRIYRYSLLYLALLFMALVADRALSVGQLEAALEPPVVLREPTIAVPGVMNLQSEAANVPPDIAGAPSGVASTVPESASGSPTAAGR